MFNILKKKKAMSYDDFGYTYAKSSFPHLCDAVAKSAKDWSDKMADEQNVSIQLATIAFAMFALSLVGLAPDGAELANRGFLKAFAEHYPQADREKVLSEMEEYTNVALADLANKGKKESFPTLVPLAITKIGGLSRNDSNWADATEFFYAFIEKAIQLPHKAFAGTSRLCKLS